MRCWPVLLASLLVQASAQTPPNSPAQHDKPYVLLIGVDGVGHDFPEKFVARRFLEFRSEGASSGGLIPCYPSTTFPNFYSIATGLTPEHHGLIDMNFFHPGRNQMFNYRDRAYSSDGSWYGGAPLWVLAEKAGLRTAAYFWVGTEAEIQSTRPTWHFPYNAETTHETRVRQVLEWFALPESHRPHLVTLYFSDVDTAFHASGVESEQVRQAMQKVDASLAQLLAGLTSVRPAVNVIIVSDHGAMQIRNKIDLNEYADLSGFRIAGAGSIVRLYSSDRSLIDRTYRKLKSASPLLNVYRRAETPRHLDSRSHPAAGDLLVIPTGPDFLLTSPAQRVHAASHGADPRRFPELRGIFYAAGPNIKPGIRLPPVRNIHLFPLVTRILGLTNPPRIDGRIKPVEALLR